MKAALDKLSLFSFKNHDYLFGFVNIKLETRVATQFHKVLQGEAAVLSMAREHGKEDHIIKCKRVKRSLQARVYLWCEELPDVCGC